MRLQDKVAIVTGSTHGIGRATALRFAREGARVVVNGRDEAAGHDVVAQIRHGGGCAHFVRADLSDEAQVRGLVDAAVDIHGGLDILVNNAAPSELVREGADALVADVAQDTWQRILRVGLDSVFWSCKYALPHLIAAGGGSVINMSSMGAHQGTPGLSAYAASKGGLEAFTVTLASEYASAGVRANCIVIGFVVTTDYARERLADPALGPVMRSISMTRPGQPDDVANAALFLASDEAEFVTASMLYVDGGASRKNPLPRPRITFPARVDKRR